MKQKTNLVVPFVFVLLTIPQFVSAQSNDLIDRLIEHEAATYADAYYMVQAAAGNTAEPPSESGSERAITLGEYSHLIMQAFDLPKGLMYRLFPGSRYATREVAYQGFIRGSEMPGRTISGREVINILRRVMDWKEESA